MAASWEIIGSNSSTSTVNDLNAHLNTVSGTRITIPHSLFDYFDEYTIQAQYDIYTIKSTLITTSMSMIQNEVNQDCVCAAPTAYNYETLECH